MGSKVDELQKALYRTAKTEPTRRFYSLFDKVYRPDALEEAGAQVRANRGAPGVDGKVIEDIEREGVAPFLTRLKCELREKTYQPGAAGVHPEVRRKAPASGNRHREGQGGAGGGRTRPRTCFRGRVPGELVWAPTGEVRSRCGGRDRLVAKLRPRASD